MNRFYMKETLVMNNGLNFLSFSSVCENFAAIFLMRLRPNNEQKIKFHIKDLFSKFDQIRSFLRIWSHLLKKFFMENVIFCAVQLTNFMPLVSFYTH